MGGSELVKGSSVAPASSWPDGWLERTGADAPVLPNGNGYNASSGLSGNRRPSMRMYLLIKMIPKLLSAHRPVPAFLANQCSAKVC